MAEETAQAFAFAARTLLETGEIPLEQLAELALREGQRTNPLYRVHRWSLLLDFGVLGSNVVREGQCLFKAIKK
jgi:hypothetical protein